MHHFINKIKKNNKTESMFQNKYLLLFFLAIFINYEYNSSCPIHWTTGGKIPSTPPMNTTFAVNQNIGTYVYTIGSGAALTSQVAQGVYSAVTDGIAAVPVYGTAISAVMSFFGPLFGGDEELNLTPLFQEFANYMDQYVSQTEYQQQINVIRAFYEGAVNSIQDVDGANINQQYNALQGATNSLASAKSIYQVEDEENVIFKYAYYSIDLLYMTALLHTSTVVGMITAQAQIEASDVNNLYSQAQTLCSTYTTLLQSYQSRAVSWRENEVSGFESEYSEYIDCYWFTNWESNSCQDYEYSWKDNLDNELFEGYGVLLYECDYGETADWHSQYISNVGSSTQAALQTYVSQYQAICASLTTTSQNPDMETIDAELNSLISSLQGM